VAGGDIALMDETQVKDRFLQMAATARALLTDFREVEQNFRGLDRAVREQIALWEGTKGELCSSAASAIERSGATLSPRSPRSSTCATFDP
jgi:hypothetical protein